MPLLSTSEALHATDSFLSSLYGDDIFRRWKELKDEMKFITEREYVSWLIDVANHYKNKDESPQLSQETDTKQFTASNVKSEESVDHYNQGQGQTYETPVSEYSHLSSTKDTRNSKNYNEQFTLDTKVEGVVNFNEQCSGTSQIVDYKCEQSYYHEDGRMVDTGANEEIILSSDEEVEAVDGPSGAIDDGHGTLQLPMGIRSSDSPKVSQSDTKRFTCPYCMMHVINLNRHILAVHEKRKPFACEHCNFHCSELYNLKGHLIHKHGYKSKYQCKNCRKYFQRQGHLTSHLLSCEAMN